MNDALPPHGPCRRFSNTRVHMAQLAHQRRRARDGARADARAVDVAHLVARALLLLHVLLLLPRLLPVRPRATQPPCCLANVSPLRPTRSRYCQRWESYSQIHRNYWNGLYKAEPNEDPFKNVDQVEGSPTNPIIG